MEAVAKTTADMPSRKWTLVVDHGRHSARRLRWRCSDWSFTTWRRLHPALAQLPPVLGQWYRERNSAALTLNCREQAARHELGVIFRLKKEFAELVQLG
jgi:hypothetical protein